MQISYSLAFSYLLLGTAIGLVIWFATGRLIDREHFGEKSQKVIFVAMILAIVGIVFAMAHLGRMDRFLNLISNPQSWLSREGFFAGAFTAGTLIYFWLMKKKQPEKTKQLDFLLYLVALAGLCTLLCMGMIYAGVKAVPVWNTTFIVLIDILSALLLGGFLFLVMTEKDLFQPTLKILTAAVFFVTIISILVNIAYEVQVGMILASLSVQGGAVPSVWLGTLARLIIGLILPAYLMVKIMKDQASQCSSYFTIALACVVIGEVIAKIMHFVIAIKTPLI